MTSNEQNNDPEKQPLIEKPKDAKEKEDVIETYNEEPFVSDSSKSICEKICAILLVVLILLIRLFLNFILCIIFLYYKKNGKGCQAVMYEKVDNILYIYLVLFIIYLIEVAIGIIYEILKKRKKLNIINLLDNLATLLKVITTLLTIVLLIVVQVYYNKSKSWRDCGNFKPWCIVWLVFNYIGLISFLLYSLCFGMLKA